ncbi:MAG TPA: ATP-binding cassette domain-containing protein, partial [Thermomicrobiales bacterium]|nr:ATP-binding cassette domain-containing protein [Thermomicrobiales bacterium]
MNAVVADRLSYRFPKATVDVLREVSWAVEDGSVTLVTGPSGAGKTTLLRCLNGLIPHFHGGMFGGDVSVLGVNTRSAGPRDLARDVGMVFQDPEAQFVTDRVEDEIVFGMENLGYDRHTMRVRLEETLDLLGINHLRQREVATLSGGERQRVAIAAALATRPAMLVLDEPTSQLDPLAAHDVLAAVQRLNSDLGMTIVVSEHRLDRVLPFADRLVAIDHARFDEGSVQDALPLLDDVPPLVELARVLGWAPAPLTVREARRMVGDVRASDKPLPNPSPVRGAFDTVRRKAPLLTGEGLGRGLRTPTIGEILLTFDSVTFRYGHTTALRDITLAGHAGEVIALIGRNGSGKTTLLKHVNGLLRPSSGRVLHVGNDIARTPVHEAARTAGYVPQHPTSILHQETLRDELRFTARAQGREITPESLLERLGLLAHIDRHPLDLSGGERQRAALAAIAVGEPDILLLDEPTR